MVTLNELLKTPELSQLNVTAGRGGLDAQIRAVSVMDSPDSYKWLKGREFILTSGFLYANDSKMVEYVLRHLIEANCSGLGIKKNRFLTELSEDVILLANKHNFPIIEIPYSFVWSDIICSFYRLYFNKEETSGHADGSSSNDTDYSHPSDTVYTKLLSALEKGDNDKAVFNAVNDKKPSDGKRFFCAVVISSDNAEPVFKLLLDNSKRVRLTKIGVTSGYFRKGQNALSLAVFEYCPNSKNIPAHEWQYMLFEDIEDAAFDAHIAAGRCYENAEDLPLSLSEAKDALNVVSNIYGGKRCYLYYSESFLCALCRNVPELVDLSLIEAFAEKQVSLRFEAFDTLEAYIKHINLAKTAETLHIHENTLRHRLQKINDFFHFNVTEPQNTLLLAVQLSLWRLKKKTKQF